MRLPTLLLVAGILALVFGSGFLLAPGTLLPLYAVDPAPPTILIARFFGVALVQLGLALYLLRETRDLVAHRGLVLAGVVGSAAGAVVALMGVLSGLTNAMGWSTVAIYVALLLGYAGAMRARSATA